MKEAAVDCGLNSADIGDVQCLRITGHPDQYIFDPNLEVDKRITGIEFKEILERKAFEPEVEEKGDSVSSSSVAAVDKLLSERSEKKTRIPKIRVKPFELDGRRYYLIPYPKESRKFKIYDALDEDFSKQLGEFEVDPITELPSRVYMYNK
jgi:hypothetical protein